ncbi:kinase-like domain-containing protein [Halteromyces radiatus]|uniref:kinase-like domain-containing protein n=1 Tax=Halteromyces radiatus TaxID=101107 RepID=UPI00221E9FBC|nr:kinase-like domain-containing protein [Halteromyces radiatus]KAI8093387.1 kinase-like domain-containing protein [Halteromyces radiatus]
MQQQSKMRKSCSDTTAVPKTTTITSVKRRSLGSLKSPTNTKHQPSSTDKPLVWRSPGYCEIPDILGNAYLLPTQPPPKPAVKKQEPPAIIRPPWYPACGSNWSPSPPPPVKPDETLFEKRLRKAVPSISLISSPKSRFIGSKEIGTGVNGSVIQVIVRGSNTRLALKRCKLDYDREYRAAIVRELRIMATGHNNLIKLKEAAVYKNEVWIAMDLMRCSVFAVLCCRGLPEEYAVYIARETLNALSYLHTKGFIHRDVKCENLLISHHGEIKLADFGLATSMKHVNQERLGTAKWMAPEVIQEHSYNEKVDLWSLGITLIEMMDRVPPHYSTKQDEEVFQKILDEPSPTFNYSYPTIYCTGLVAWLLEENPDNRPSAKDVMMELDLHVEQGLLKTSNAQQLSNFVNKTLI